MEESSGSFERVIVELEWYDGERAGIANLHGVPHYFYTDDYTHPPDDATFLTWPVDEETLSLEIECWRIFVDWNDRIEAGEATAASHPGHGGISRYDELTLLVEPHRLPPDSAIPRRAQWRGTGRRPRYGPDGPASEVRWADVGGADTSIFGADEP